MQLPPETTRSALDPAELPLVRDIVLDTLAIDPTGPVPDIIDAGSVVDGDTHWFAVGQCDGDRVRVETVRWRVDASGLSVIDPDARLQWISTEEVSAATPVQADDQFVAVETYSGSRFVMLTRDFVRMN